MSKLEQKYISLMPADRPSAAYRQIVSLLRGKQKAHFDPAVLDNDRVKVVNAAKLKFTDENWYKDYRHHDVSRRTKTDANEKVLTLIRQKLFVTRSRVCCQNKQRREILKRLLIEK